MKAIVGLCVLCILVLAPSWLLYRGATTLRTGARWLFAMSAPPVYVTCLIISLHVIYKFPLFFDRADFLAYSITRHRYPLTIQPVTVFCANLPGGVVVTAGYFFLKRRCSKMLPKPLNPQS